MLVTGLLFVAVTAIVKHVGSGVPAAEAAFLRYVLGAVFLLPMLKSISAAHLTKTDILWFGARGMIHALGVILWFYGMTKISIAEVTAMNYMSPIYVTIGAALFLGERLASRRIAAIFIAFLGALIILRPGFREINSGHIAMIGTALFFAGSYLITGRMAAKFSPAVVVGMLSIMVPIGLAPFAAAVWVTPTPEQLAWLFLVAAFATAGHYTMTLAFQAAPMTVTQPVTFLQLIWSTMLGALFFMEPVDFWVVLGGGVILASVIFITWREAFLRRIELFEAAKNIDTIDG